MEFVKLFSVQRNLHFGPNGWRGVPYPMEICLVGIKPHRNLFIKVWYHAGMLYRKAELKWKSSVPYFHKNSFLLLQKTLRKTYENN